MTIQDISIFFAEVYPTRTVAITSDSWIFRNPDGPAKNKHRISFLPGFDGEECKSFHSNDGEDLEAFFNRINILLTTAH